MAVTVDSALPNQPADGEVQLTPLGGDGFVAPHSLYTVRTVLTHDASGGLAALSVRFDPRYTQLLVYFHVEQKSAPGTKEVLMSIQCTASDVLQIHQVIPAISIAGQTATNMVLWTPPAILCSAPLGEDSAPPFFRVLCANVDTESTIIRARVFNFDKRAREVVPLSQLLSSLLRGTDTT